MGRASKLLVLPLAAIFAEGCLDSSSTGGVTAQIIWPDLSPGISKQALRAAAVPPQVGRLQIQALDGTDGSTLAETNLYASPGDGQDRLNSMGGDWTLEDVKVGTNRIIRAQAYLGPNADPRINNLMLFEAQIPNVEVRPGETVDAGILRLRMIEGVRYPPLDVTPPDPPVLTVTAVDEGEALWVSFTRPAQPDVEGYIIAYSMMPSTATISRGQRVDVGDELAPGVIVADRLWTPEPEMTRIGGLLNNWLYTIYIFAYDEDLDGEALNFSAAETAVGTAQDRKPPGQVTNLSIVPGATIDTAQLSFVATGEDDNIGLATEYEVRTSTNLAILNNPATFEDLDPLRSPMAKDPGELVTETYTYAELRQTGLSSFYVGVRAKDFSNNAGPIATAQFTVNATLPPAITDLAPSMVIAGNEVRVSGRNFGGAGLVYLSTTTGSIALSPSRYSDSVVTVPIPATTPSGVLTVRRLPDGLEAGAYLVVIAKEVDAFGGYTGPFEVVSIESEPGVQNAALYRERAVAMDYEGAIERIYDLTADPTPLAPYVSADRSTAIAGAYDPITERFLFVASNTANTMTYASVSTSTLSPQDDREPVIANAGGADRVSLAVLRGGAVEIPALLAFSLGGVIRTATVADIQVQPFGLFWVTSSTIAGTTYDQVTVRVSAAGDATMAYRETSGGIARLGLRYNPDPYLYNEFNELPAADRPRMSNRAELINVPTPTGEVMIVAYEELDVTIDATEVRLLRVEDYGTTRGYAPFDREINGRTLEDIGLVVRQDEVWIAVLSDRGASLQYTELPLSALDLGEAGRGAYRGIILDSAAGPTLGRLGCKILATQACPIVWLGTNVQVLFTRR